MRMPGVMARSALRQVRIEFEFGQPRAGGDDIAGLAGHAQQGAGAGRRHVDDGLRRLHRYQRIIEADDLADGDMPLDDLGIGQALAEVGQQEQLRGAHAGGVLGQETASVRFAAATIFSTEGRYFISRRNSGIGTS